MPLSIFFDTDEYHLPTHQWLLVSQKNQNITLEEIAWDLAINIVHFRCQRCSHHYLAWLNKVENNIALTPASSSALSAFLVPTFGEPGNHFAPGRLDHLEGFVCQMLWYFITLENPGDIIEYQIPPGFKSTDPGGDGFIVHRLPDNLLMFRLWEMKKYSPPSGDNSAGINGTVDRAYTQLTSKAMEYLARITTTEQVAANPEVEVFLGMLPDLWAEASPQAAAGIFIATSIGHVSTNCFDDFGNRFPLFIQPIRLKGMLASVLDFSRLSILVQEFIWKGL
jgi:hypothetical protein